MWQPIASAWTTLSSSRGLAQISSARGAARMISSASRMIGIGSRPVSAIRPAKTEMQLGAPSATAAVIVAHLRGREQRGDVDLDAVAR